MSPHLDIPLPEGARLVAGALASAGYDTFVVGGTVRDALLGRPLVDVDVATSAQPEEVDDLASRLPWVDARWDAGARFGTIGLAVFGTRLEITSLRGDSIEQPDATSRFAADAKLRDFTVNALAVLLPDGELLDPLDGRSDLAARLLRSPGSAVSRFSEDALRVMRLGRFVAELGFDVEPLTMQAATETSFLLADVAPERLRAELWRTLQAPGVARGLRIVRDVGAMRVVLPEAAIDDDTFAFVATLPPDPERRLAGLMPRDETVAEEVCGRLRCSRRQLRRLRYFLSHGVDADPDTEPVYPLGGNAIIRELGVAPGPLVGLVKRALAEAVAERVIERDDREGALALARQVLGMSVVPGVEEGAKHE